jgi:diguanylate cyclase (GGDEF)-like protein/PAS domain S-box-containing protein
VLYFATGKLGLSLATTYDSVTLIWPPTGIALAALVLLGGRFWPWVAVGAIAVNVSDDLALGAAIGIAAGNTLAMVVGAECLQRFDFRPELERVPDVGRLLVFGCALSAAISATVGSLCLLIFGVIPASEATSAWWRWWLGDGLGILFLSPLLLTVGAGYQAGRSTWPRWRIILPSTVILSVFAALFVAWRDEAGGHYVLLFGPVPLVAWVGLRSGPRGVSWVIFALIATGTTLTAYGVGPFVTSPPETGLLMLLGFAGGTALIGFMLGASHAEEQAATDRLRLAGTVFDNANEGIVLTDSTGRIRLVNEAFRRLCGLAKGEARGRPLDDFRRGTEEAGDFLALRKRLEEEQAATGESRYGRADTEGVPAWESYIGVPDATGKLARVIGIFSDISRIKAYEERLAHDARHDALTGLLNRRTFREELERSLAQSRRHGHALGLLFIDLDRFKLINDTFGHHAGDELLVQVADRLRESVRAEDVVARLGGDEFTILLTEVEGAEGVLRAARQVAAALRAPLSLIQEKVVVRPSIGGAAFPEDGETTDELLRAADDAMFRAKASGSGAIHLAREGEPSQTELSRDSLALVQSALASGAVDLLYQPVVCGRSGRLAGLEALVSGRLPGRQGALTPRDYVEAAERLGESSRLTSLVLSRVSEDLAAWRAEGLEPTEMAVNIPGRLILSDSGVEELGWLLSELGLSSIRTQLTLEFTESALKATQHARERLDRLRAAGFSFGLDSFGLGDSSLTDLKEAPIDGVKIDRALVGRVPGNKADEAICHGLVQIVKALDLRVVAVGVETAEQRDFLIEHGCGLMQGRLFHPPASRARTGQILRKAGGQAMTAGDAPVA